MKSRLRRRSYFLQAPCLVQRLSGTLMTQLVNATNKAWWSLSSSSPRTLLSSWPWTLHLDTDRKQITMMAFNSSETSTRLCGLTWTGCRRQCPPAVWKWSCRWDACWPKPSGLCRLPSPGTSPSGPCRGQQKRQPQSGSAWTCEGKHWPSAISEKLHWHQSHRTKASPHNFKLLVCKHQILVSGSWISVPSKDTWWYFSVNVSYRCLTWPISLVSLSSEVCKSLYVCSCHPNTNNQ